LSVDKSIVMTAEEQTISLFETRVRELILAYSEQKTMLADLRRKISEQEAEIALLKDEVSRLEGEYTTLKEARMLTVAGGDTEALRKKDCQYDTHYRQVRGFPWRGIVILENGR